MRIIVSLIIVAVLLSSCSEYQKTLKSDDYELKYKKAIEYYKAEEYARSIALLESVLSIYRGTTKEEDVHYYYASANYKQGDYIMGGYYYRNFAKTFPNSKRVEECEYLGAYCYYLDSPRFGLDQSNTIEAISALQVFVNKYPHSTYAQECNELISELRIKLEKKAFEGGKLYFDIENYKAAWITFENLLKEFPDTKYREDALFLMFKAKYLYAKNSIEKKQEERYRDCVKQYYPFIDNFPQSKYLKEAEKMFEFCQERIEEIEKLALDK